MLRIVPHAKLIKLDLFSQVLIESTLHAFYSL